jgi:hypothetical protein
VTTNLAVPSPRTFSVNEVQTAAFLNSIRDALSFLVNVPIATIYQTASQTLTASGTAYAVAYDSTAVDTYGGHSNTVNNSQYVSQVPGWYIVTGAVVFSPSTSGTYRKIQGYHNGSVVAYAASQVPGVNNASNATAVPIAPTIVYLNAGDYIQLYATCDVAGLTITPNASNASYATILWQHS